MLVASNLFAILPVVQLMRRGLRVEAVAVALAACASMLYHGFEDTQYADSLLLIDRIAAVSAVVIYIASLRPSLWTMPEALSPFATLGASELVKARHEMGYYAFLHGCWHAAVFLYAYEFALIKDQ